ncbi:hypothetical protein FKM82_018561 [Ascaphus truei]
MPHCHLLRCKWCQPFHLILTNLKTRPTNQASQQPALMAIVPHPVTPTTHCGQAQPSTALIPSPAVSVSSPQTFDCKLFGAGISFPIV